MARLLPHDHEAEAAVLGALLSDSGLYPLAARCLGEPDFHHPLHRAVFGAIARLFAEGKLADPTAVHTKLSEQGQVRLAGGMEQLFALRSKGASPASLEQHITTIRDKSLRRRHYKACLDAAEVVLDEKNYSVADAFRVASEKLAAAGRDIYLSRVCGAGELAAERIKEFSGGVPLKAVPTGFAAFDRLTGGLPLGQMALLAGRPGMGKTQLACDIALNASLDWNVLFCTLEMTAKRLIDRMVCSLAGVSGTAYRRGLLSGMEESKVVAAASALSSRRLKVVEGRLTTGDIRLLAYSEKARGGLDLLVIDYLSKIADKPRASASLNEHIGAISSAMQSLAVEQDIAVLLLCQLNRQVESRNPPVPNNSDLRDSGHLEQDADIIALLYREEYYTGRRSGEADLVVSKSRDGETGVCVLGFSPREPRFVNLELEKMEKGGNIDPWDEQGFC